MDYRERPPPEALTGLVKTFWSLHGGGEAAATLEHCATPDGCIEIIRRLSGTSRWGSEQPPCFVVGLIERTECFEISGDARFIAVRIWPWAWGLLSDTPVDALRGAWAPADEPGLQRLCAALDQPEAAERLLLDRMSAGGAGRAAIGRAVIGSASVAEMAARARLSPRALQRWFERHVGLPPRSYLRLLRFQKALETLPGQPSLADHAAATGFADQAHMARDFRAMAGLSAREARHTAKGPFVS